MNTKSRLSASSLHGASCAALAMMLAGCVSTNSTVLNPTGTKHAGTVPAQVVFYRTADQVPGKYEELALLTSREDSIWRSEAAMLDSIRESASKAGANGVILDASSEPSAGAKVASFFFFGFDVSGRKNKAVAIYVLPAEQPATIVREVRPEEAGLIPVIAGKP